MARLYTAGLDAELSRIAAHFPTVQAVVVAIDRCDARQTQLATVEQRQQEAITRAQLLRLLGHHAHHAGKP